MPGAAKDPIRRVTLLQTGNPALLVIRHVLPLDYERALHWRFARQRLRGEWFNDSDTILGEARRWSLWLRADPARVEQDAFFDYLKAA